MEFYTGNLCQNQQSGVYNLFLKIQIKGLEGACSLLAPVIYPGGDVPLFFSERNVSPFLKSPVHIVDYYSLFIPVYCMVELAYCYVQTDY